MLKRISSNIIIYRYTILIISLYISAINFNLFLKPINFVTGGTTGLAIIIEHLFHIETTWFIFVVYMIMMIISYFILGKESIIGIIFISFIYPLFIKVTSGIIDIVVLNYDDMLLFSIITGILSGISSGLIYKYGFASSGLGILGPICHKLFKFPISTTGFVINSGIVLLGSYYFGIDMILYAIIALYINHIITNRIILGISEYKALFIQSNKLTKIIDELNKDSIIKAINIKVLGTYKKKYREMILLIIKTKDYREIVELVNKIDDKTFMLTHDSYEVS